MLHIQVQVQHSTVFVQYLLTQLATTNKCIYACIGGIQYSASTVPGHSGSNNSVYMQMQVQHSTVLLQYLDTQSSTTMCR